MEYNENEIKYLEETENIDGAMLFKEIKKLNDKVDTIKEGVPAKNDREKRNDILAIKSPIERQRAIRENIELFADMFPGRK